MPHRCFLHLLLEFTFKLDLVVRKFDLEAIFSVAADEYAWNDDEWRLFRLEKFQTFL